MMDEVNAGYRGGRFSYLELIEARRQLLEGEQSAVDAAARIHLVLLELERPTGQALVTQAGRTTGGTAQ